MMLEIVLMICGIICVVLSYVLDNGKNESVENQNLSAELTEKQKESIQNQINAVIENELEALSEKTEVTLEKISNTKIMELNDYADTVLGEINRNHNETVFLYDMLNEKSKEVKSTVKNVNVTKKQVEKMQAEVSVTEEKSDNNDYDSDKESTAAAIQMLTGKSNNTLKKSMNSTSNSSDGNDSIATAKLSKTKKSASNKIAENIVEMNIQFEKGANNNDKILKLYMDGKSNKDIAKELSLGVGEVKLVIDLYNSGK